MKSVILALLVSVTTLAIADPLVIAHRGASGYLPEHTLDAYRLAIEQGADFIEPDLVVTRDGVLVCRHDTYLGTTTNVATKPGFANRKRSVGNRDDWFVSDFTLAELATLRARQPFATRDQSHNDKLAIPTFQQVIDLVLAHEAATGKRIGLYPELKAPPFFREAGHDTGALLLAQLEVNNLATARDRVYIQSFDAETLRQLRPETGLPLVMLVRPKSREALSEPNVPLADVATFADVLGAHKFMVIGPGGQPTDLVARARQFNLEVHTWTYRNDRPGPSFADLESELRAALAAGIDGFFTDHPDVGRRVTDRYRSVQ